MATAGETATILHALRQRRTSRDYEDRDVPRHVLEDMVEAVRWAPNHRNTEPWRIFVLNRGSAKRNEIADLVAQWTYDSIKNPAPGRREGSADAARQEILDAPSFIYMYSDTRSHRRGDHGELRRYLLRRPEHATCRIRPRCGSRLVHGKTDQT